VFQQHPAITSQTLQCIATAAGGAGTSGAAIHVGLQVGGYAWRTTQPRPTLDPAPDDIQFARQRISPGIHCSMNQGGM
jgi:hypothetical protein